MKILSFLFISQLQIFAQLIAGWNTPTPPGYLISDSTSVILAEFWLPSDSIEIMTASNYQISDDSGLQLPIISISYLTELDGLEIIFTRLVALRVPRLNYRRSYQVKYKTEISSFWNNGFIPWRESAPDFSIQKL